MKHIFNDLNVLKATIIIFCLNLVFQNFAITFVEDFVNLH